MYEAGIRSNGELRTYPKLQKLAATPRVVSCCRRNVRFSGRRGTKKPLRRVLTHLDIFANAVPLAIEGASRRRCLQRFSRKLVAGPSNTVGRISPSTSMLRRLLERAGPLISVPSATPTLKRLGIRPKLHNKRKGGFKYDS